ncbi:venom allergen 5-like [Dermacentor andersoni]|uniref:venom allergen 5-like n=1 Tax=Dermacentor andersoni TaxID=34620 RepID=UPI003B3AA72B
MYRLEAATCFSLVFSAMTSVHLGTVDALIQGRCRPEYRNLPSGVTHTACKGPNPRCTLDRALTGLSPQVKQQALQVHNDYRSQVAQGRLPNYPPAKNMYELEWDDEIAEVAQAFAEQCDYSNHDHREARITSRFKAVGQCFGWAVDPVRQTVTEGKTWIDDWFIEYRDFNPNSVAPFDTSTSTGVVTHFTQVNYL